MSTYVLLATRFSMLSLRAARVLEVICSLSISAIFLRAASS